jgi:hypothetical protein
MSTILKDTQGEFYCKPRGAVYIEFTQIRWFSGQSRGGWTFDWQPRMLKTKLAQGGAIRLDPLRSDGYHDSQMGGWTMLTVAKGA